MRRCSAFGLLPMVLATLSVAGSVKVGWREIDGINVSSGSVTQTTPVVIGFGGTFAKSGVGELKLSMAQMNSSFSNNVEVLDGTLALSPGIDTTVDLLHPPAVFSKAAYWCAADSTNLITEMDGGKTRVSKWCDVRETNRSSPSSYGNNCQGPIACETVQACRSTFSSRRQRRTLWWK